MNREIIKPELTLICVVVDNGINKLASSRLPTVMAERTNDGDLLNAYKTNNEVNIGEGANEHFQQGESVSTTGQKDRQR